MSEQKTLNNTSSRSDDIDKEVQYLLKKNADKVKTNYAILQELKSKFKDDEIVENIMRKYSEKLKRVRKISEKIKERLVAKHPLLTMKEYIEKIAEYKKKYNFDDSEMQAIINLIFLKKTTLSNTEVLDVNYNEMSKALGFIPASYNLSGKLSYTKNDEDHLNAILTIASVAKELHNQVTLQSIIYTDEDDVAIQGTFERAKINIFSFVHPVVAALFLPKFNFLDEHMLLASIAEIVSYKHHGQELQTQPEYEVYWDIATDPAETACVVKTKPFSDLVSRCNVQTKLWEAVLSLRQGKYYMNDLSSFILAIDNCKASVFDAADLAYVKDEGTILRKLLATFSIRPTIVLTAPVMGIHNLTSNISSLSSSHITTLPMITMRIPMNLQNIHSDIHLEDSLDQQQLYIHHRQLTIKSQQILYSRELLIFYVHRRYQTLDIARLTRPYQIAYLPITMNAFEKLQKIKVNFSFTILNKIPNQEFELKSIVAVETSPHADQADMIIGCSAIVRSNNIGTGVSSGYYYNPLDLSSVGTSSSGTSGSQFVNAINIITDNASPSNPVSIFNVGSERGTLFIYKSVGSNTPANALFL